MRVLNHPCVSSILLLAVVCVPAVAQPDVIVGAITGPSNYSTDPGYDAFSLGTTSCNIGTQNLTWISSTNQHPVIGGNLYKYDAAAGGRFTMIGRSWLKHGFGALQENLCQPCTGTGNWQALGVGCSDPYGSSLNGQQSPLGPRSEVNASTGYFPFPPSNPTYSGSTDRRLKVPLALLDPSAQYVSEAQYIQPEDAMAGNGNNNASYRMSSISGSSNYSLSFTAPTVREEPAINAWAVLDQGVVLQTLQVPGADGGQLTLGVKRTDNGNGTWHFEVVLHNLNCNDAVGGVQVTFASGVTITNQGFHAPEWHSNSVHNNNPWIASTTADAAVWMVDGSPSLQANVIRWGTAFTFWFDADDPDVLGTNVDLHISGGSDAFPAPPFPTEDWETNGPDAHLDVDGNATNDPFVGPIQLGIASDTSHTATIDGTVGQPYELYLTSVAAVPAVYKSADDEIVNLNLIHPSFVGLFGNNPVMPSGGVTVPFNLPGTWFFAGQVWSANPAAVDGYSLSAATELTVTPLPRVTVECVGTNSYVNDPNGFWRVIHNGTTTANITSVTLSFQGVSSGVFFDTDQGLPGGGGTFNQGNTYRQNSDVVTGLDYGVSSPFSGAGWIGTNALSSASFNTIEFQFTGGLFNGNTFRFDSDTDPGTVSASAHAGMSVTVTLDDGSTMVGTFTVDPANGDRCFVDLQ